MNVMRATGYFFAGGLAAAAAGFAASSSLATRFGLTVPFAGVKL
jgi:hypothetical protein